MRSDRDQRQVDRVVNKIVELTVQQNQILRHLNNDSITIAQEERDDLKNQHKLLGDQAIGLYGSNVEMLDDLDVNDIPKAVAIAELGNAELREIYATHEKNSPALKSAQEEKAEQIAELTKMGVSEDDLAQIEQDAVERHKNDEIGQFFRQVNGDNNVDDVLAGQDGPQVFRVTKDDIEDRQKILNQGKVVVEALNNDVVNDIVIQPDAATLNPGTIPVRVESINGVDTKPVTPELGDGGTAVSSVKPIPTPIPTSLTQTPPTLGNVQEPVKVTVDSIPAPSLTPDEMLKAEEAAKLVQKVVRGRQARTIAKDIKDFKNVVGAARLDSAIDKGRSRTIEALLKQDTEHNHLSDSVLVKAFGQEDAILSTGGDNAVEVKRNNSLSSTIKNAVFKHYLEAKGDGKKLIADDQLDLKGEVERLVEANNVELVALAMDNLDGTLGVLDMKPEMKAEVNTQRFLNQMDKALAGQTQTAIPLKFEPADPNAIIVSKNPTLMQKYLTGVPQATLIQTAYDKALAGGSPVVMTAIMESLKPVEGKTTPTVKTPVTFELNVPFRKEPFKMKSSYITSPVSVTTAAFEADKEFGKNNTSVVNEYTVTKAVLQDHKVSIDDWKSVRDVVWSKDQKATLLGFASGDDLYATKGFSNLQKAASAVDQVQQQSRIDLCVCIQEGLVGAGEALLESRSRFGSLASSSLPFDAQGRNALQYLLEETNVEAPAPKANSSIKAGPYEKGQRQFDMAKSFVQRDPNVLLVKDNLGRNALHSALVNNATSAGIDALKAGLGTDVAKDKLLTAARAVDKNGVSAIEAMVTHNSVANVNAILTGLKDTIPVSELTATVKVDGKDQKLDVVGLAIRAGNDGLVSELFSERGVLSDYTVGTDTIDVLVGSSAGKSSENIDEMITALNSKTTLTGEVQNHLIQKAAAKENPALVGGIISGLDTGAAKLLLESSAEGKKSALQTMIDNNQVQNLDALLKSDTLEDKKDDLKIKQTVDGVEKEIPLISYAASLGRADIVRTLINNGVDVNAAGKDGTPPINTALLHALKDKSVAKVAGAGSVADFEKTALALLASDNINLEHESSPEIDAVALADRYGQKNVVSVGGMSNQSKGQKAIQEAVNNKFTSLNADLFKESERDAAGKEVASIIGKSNAKDIQTALRSNDLEQISKLLTSHSPESLMVTKTFMDIGSGANWTQNADGKEQEHLLDRVIRNTEHSAIFGNKDQSLLQKLAKFAPEMLSVDAAIDKEIAAENAKITAANKVEGATVQTLRARSNIDTVSNAAEINARVDILQQRLRDAVGSKFRSESSINDEVSAILEVGKVAGLNLLKEGGLENAPDIMVNGKPILVAAAQNVSITSFGTSGMSKVALTLIDGGADVTAMYSRDTTILGTGTRTEQASISRDLGRLNTETLMKIQQKAPDGVTAKVDEFNKTKGDLAKLVTEFKPGNAGQNSVSTFIADNKEFIRDLKVPASRVNYQGVIPVFSYQDVPYIESVAKTDIRLAVELSADYEGQDLPKGFQQQLASKLTDIAENGKASYLSNLTDVRDVNPARQAQMTDELGAILRVKSGISKTDLNKAASTMVSNGNYEMLNQMIDAGVEVPSKTRQEALEKAFAEKNFEQAAKLIESGAPASAVLEQAAKFKMYGFIKDVTHSDKAQATTIHFDGSIITAERGANVDKVDVVGDPALGALKVMQGQMRSMARVSPFSSVDKDAIKANVTAILDAVPEGRLNEFTGSDRPQSGSMELFNNSKINSHTVVGIAGKHQGEGAIAVLNGLGEYKANHPDADMTLQSTYRDGSLKNVFHQLGDKLSADAKGAFEASNIEPQIPDQAVASGNYAYVKEYLNGEVSTVHQDDRTDEQDQEVEVRQNTRVGMLKEMQAELRGIIRAKTVFAMDPEEVTKKVNVILDAVPPYMLNEFLGTSLKEEASERQTAIFENSKSLNGNSILETAAGHSHGPLESVSAKAALEAIAKFEGVVIDQAVVAKYDGKVMGTAMAALNDNVIRANPVVVAEPSIEESVNVGRVSSLFADMDEEELENRVDKPTADNVGVSGGPGNKKVGLNVRLLEEIARRAATKEGQDQEKVSQPEPVITAATKEGQDQEKVSQPEPVITAATKEGQDQERVSQPEPVITAATKEGQDQERVSQPEPVITAATKEGQDQEKVSQPEPGQSYFNQVWNFAANTAATTYAAAQQVGETLGNMTDALGGVDQQEQEPEPSVQEQVKAAVQGVGNNNGQNSISAANLVNKDNGRDKEIG